MDGSLPGSSVHGILQNTGVGKPFPSPGDLPKPGIEPRFPAFQVDSLPSESPGKPAKSLKSPPFLLLILLALSLNLPAAFKSTAPSTSQTLGE